MDKEDSIYTVLSLFGILALILSLFAMLNIRTDYLELTGLPNLNNYANKSDIPQSFPYSNLTGYPNTFPYNNLTDYPNTFPYNNLTGYPNTFPYNNLTGYPNTFPYNNLTGVPVVYNLTDGLILWLPLNDGIGNASDHSGFMNHGVITGVLWVDGKYGKALNFDGINDYVNLPYALLDSEDFSVGMWIKGIGIPFSTLTVHNLYHYFRQNVIVWSFHTDNLDGTNDDWDITFPTGYNTSVYNYIMISVERLGDDYIKRLYFNGVFYTSKTVANKDIDEWKSPCCIGVLIYGIGGGDKALWFNGDIDEVRIYNRALSSGEVLALYNLP